MRVLVVDDDGATQDVLRMVLEEEGYVVSVASSGHAAQAVLWLSQEPMLVLVDQRMPGMLGTQLVQAVLGDGRPATAFILLTASPDRLSPPFNLAAMQLVVPVLAKPFNLEVLLAVVAAGSAQLAVTPPLPYVGASWR